jgi:hypothetical protein
LLVTLHLLCLGWEKKLNQNNAIFLKILAL